MLVAAGRSLIGECIWRCSPIRVGSVRGLPLGLGFLDHPHRGIELRHHNGRCAGEAGCQQKQERRNKCAWRWDPSSEGPRENQSEHERDASEPLVDYERARDEADAPLARIRRTQSIVIATSSKPSMPNVTAPHIG